MKKGHFGELHAQHGRATQSNDEVQRGHKSIKAAVASLANNGPSASALWK